MTTTPATVASTPAGSGPRAKHLSTAKGAEELRAELVRLREQKEREISPQLREARGFGETASNDEHLAIREEELVLDARIASLEGILDRASIMDGAGLDPRVVAVGSTVTAAAFGTETERRYRIVGMHERHQPNDVSAGSPLGRRWWADGGGIQRRSRFRAGKNGVFGSSPVPS